MAMISAHGNLELGHPGPAQPSGADFIGPKDTALRVARLLQGTADAFGTDYWNHTEYAPTYFGSDEYRVAVIFDGERVRYVERDEANTILFR